MSPFARRDMESILTSLRTMHASSRSLVPCLTGTPTSWLLATASRQAMTENVWYDIIHLERVDPSASSQDSATASVLAASNDALSPESPAVFLVVGEAGDGKSTLINQLRDPERSGEPSMSLGRVVTEYGECALRCSGHTYIASVGSQPRTSAITRTMSSRWASKMARCP